LALSGKGASQKKTKTDTFTQKIDLLEMAKKLTKTPFSTERPPYKTISGTPIFKHEAQALGVLSI